MAYQGYLKVESDNTQVSATLSNFKACLDLSLIPTAQWSNIRTDGGNLYVTDSSNTRVPAVVTWIDTVNEQGIIWFKMTTINGASNTEMRIHIDDTSTTTPARNSTYGEENVFSDCIVRLSLIESSTTFVDSSPNNFAMDTNDVGSAVTGPLGGGRSFDGINDIIHFPTSAMAVFKSDVSTAFTMEFWYNGDVSGGGDFLNCSTTRGGVKTGIGIGWRNDSVLNSYLGLGGALWVNSISTTTVTTGSWEYYNITWDGTNLKFYKGGSLGSTVSRSGTLDWDGTDTDDMQIGIMGNYHETSPLVTATTLCTAGDLEEFRFLDTTLSDDMISTQYNNQNNPDTFWTNTSFVSSSPPVSIKSQVLCIN